jgi:TubC N-terminal docking domain
MTAPEILTTLRQRGASVRVGGSDLVVEAPKGAFTPQLRQAVAAHKGDLLRLLQGPALDADAGELAAVKLRNTLIGDAWLVRDPEALVEHTDIIRSGLPVFFFDEVERLRGKTPAELQAIGTVKVIFPTGRVLQ